MLELRQALDKISNDENINKHYPKIKNIRKKYKHKIDLIDRPPCWPNNYNCYEYCLSVHNNQKYIGTDGLKSKLCSIGDNDIFINSEFIQYLIDKKILIKDTKGPIVIYFSDKKVKHGGILKNSHVVSKWGKGNLYEHGIFEIPEQYGNSWKTFKKVEESLVIKCFKDYADVRCGNIERDL